MSLFEVYIGELVPLVVCEILSLFTLLICFLILNTLLAAYKDRKKEIIEITLAEILKISRLLKSFPP